MGVIQKQAIAGTIYTYLGVGLGFVTTGLLMPHALTTDQVGLLKLLVSFSTLFATFGNLGTVNVTVKQFPYFRDEQQQHNGYLFILLTSNLLGFVLMCLAFFALKPLLISSNVDKSPLFVDYIFYIPLLFFFIQFFSAFDAYFRSQFNAIKGTVAKEVLQRVIHFILLVLFFFTDLLGFGMFVFLYCSTFAIPTLYLILSAKLNGYLFLKPKLSFVSREMRNEMVSVGLLGIITGISNMLVLHIDSIMIGSMHGLESTGIYSICFFFGTLIIMPSRMLKKIGGSVIAEAWKKNNTNEVATIYQKSTINQLLIGMFVFVGIWTNTDLIFHILPSEYEKGLYVLLFIGLANVMEMTGGLSVIVIGTSKKYKYNTIFVLIFVLSVIGFNYLLIPLYGITGAAIASFISISIYKLIKYLFLLFSYRFQPYSWKHFAVFAIGALSIVTCKYIAVSVNVFINAFMYSALVTVIFGCGAYFLNLSEDANRFVNNLLRKM